MVMAPDQSKIIVGGAFTHGQRRQPTTAWRALDPTTGATLPWAANRRSQTPAPTRRSHAVDRRHQHLRRRLRLRLRRQPRGHLRGRPVDRRHQLGRGLPRRHLLHLPDGNARLHGRPPALLRQLGGFPQTNPWVIAPRRRPSRRPSPAPRCTTPKAATPTSAAPRHPRCSTGSRPDRRHLHRPEPGRLDRHRQRQYVVEGGEFPTVNGIGQQGLVRFAVRAIAPNKLGPMVTGAKLRPDASRRITVGHGPGRVPGQLGPGQHRADLQGRA